MSLFNQYKHIFSVIFSTSAAIFVYTESDKIKDKENLKKELKTVFVFFLVIALLSLFLQVQEKSLDSNVLKIVLGIISILYAVAGIMLLDRMGKYDSFKIIGSICLAFLCAYLFMLWKKIIVNSELPSRTYHDLYENKENENTNQYVNLQTDSQSESDSPLKTDSQSESDSPLKTDSQSESDGDFIYKNGRRYAKPLRTGS